MKKIFGILVLGLIVGCCNCRNQTIDDVKLQKAIRLADQIEMNGYKLVATNKTIILIAPTQR